MHSFKKSFFSIATFILFSTNAFAQNTIVVITPHPDDAEASCGGLIANATAEGEKVIILTMTGGELCIGGKTEEEAKNIRTKEAQNGATILGASILFFNAIDASLLVDKNNLQKLKQFLLDIHPDIVLAPWPMDVHPDHQATGMLAWQVFQDNKFSFDLYFYETTNSPHTKSFAFVPTDYVDISQVMNKKKDAVLQHISQHPNEWYSMYEILATVRGYEADVTYAEAYIKAQNSSGMGGRSNKLKKLITK